MFVVTVIFAGRENGVMLWFDDADAARKAYQALLAGEAVSDHYSNMLWVRERPAAVLLADHERQLRAQAECGLIQARVQADTNDQAATDPVIRQAQAKARAAAARQMGGSGGFPILQG